MAVGLERAVGELAGRLKLEGWLNIPEGCLQPTRFIHLHEARPAGRNEPTEAGVAGTQKMIEMIQSLGPRDWCLVLLSGGGSALLPAPVSGVDLKAKLQTTRFLSARRREYRTAQHRAESPVTNQRGRVSSTLQGRTTRYVDYLGCLGRPVGRHREWSDRLQHDRFGGGDFASSTNLTLSGHWSTTRSIGRWTVPSQAKPCEPCPNVPVRRASHWEFGGGRRRGGGRGREARLCPRDGLRSGHGRNSRVGRSAPRPTCLSNETARRSRLFDYGGRTDRATRSGGAARDWRSKSTAGAGGSYGIATPGPGGSGRPSGAGLVRACASCPVVLTVRTDRPMRRGDGLMLVSNRAADPKNCR